MSQKCIFQQKIPHTPRIEKAPPKPNHPHPHAPTLTPTTTKLTSIHRRPLTPTPIRKSSGENFKIRKFENSKIRKFETELRVLHVWNDPGQRIRQRIRSDPIVGLNLLGTEIDQISLKLFIRFDDPKCHKYAVVNGKNKILVIRRIFQVLNSKLFLMRNTNDYLTHLLIRS